MVAMVVASREERKAMRTETVETHEAVHCWWMFLHMNLRDGDRGFDPLVREVQG